MEIVHIDFSVAKDCLNPWDSYDEICVKCNCCGRFDESKKYEARIRTYKRQLEEENSFDGWLEGCRELQESNIKANTEYLNKLISEAEKAISVKGVKKGVVE